MYLVIDTSTRFGAVGLWPRAGHSYSRVIAWRSRHNHTAELLPAIENLLRCEGMSPAGLRGVGVACGPGGFSALRAGLGAAKGLAFALGVPIVGESTLESAAYVHRYAGWPVCSIIEGGRGSVGWARFHLVEEGWRRRTPDRITPLEELLGSGGRHTLFCGEGAATHAERLREAMGPRAHLALEPMPLGRLQGLGELASARLDKGESDSVAGLQASYLRPPVITQPKAPRPVRYGAAAKPTGPTTPT